MPAKVISNTGAIAPMLDLLTKRLKQSPKSSQQGFTLVELLVAMVIATIIITPLLGFMVNTLNSDRKEQIKATSEAELQAAIDYISQDLEQAVYIYSPTALAANNSTTSPSTSGIKNQIPPVAPTAGCTTSACTPVLVFWKRETEKNVLPIAVSPTPSPAPKDDTFVYSLVAYYLVKDAESGKWSNTARIVRFQIKDGVIDPNNPGTLTNPIHITGYQPSAGYRGFDITAPGSTLTDKMNQWTKTTTPYNTPVVTLIDFVDKDTTAPRQNCPTNTVASTVAGGFYACVDSANTLAQVYIRGNSLARMNDNNSYSTGNSTYFPTASVQVKGRGFLGVN